MLLPHELLRDRLNPNHSRDHFTRLSEIKTKTSNRATDTKKLFPPIENKRGYFERDVLEKMAEVHNQPKMTLTETWQEFY